MEPPRSANRPLAWRLFTAGLSALVLWSGEALVGLVPLLGHLVVANFSTHLVYLAYCQAGTKTCLEVTETLPVAEINIISVVTCGLGILSLVKFGPTSRSHRTPMTYLAGIAALGLLIFASFLYALTSAGIGAGSSVVTIWVLVFSLLVSFYLALEDAWLAVLNSA